MAKALVPRLIFEEPGVNWASFPNNGAHKEFAGCFRCHDNKHKTETGEKVSKKCGTCHNLVVDEESNSPLLQELGIQEAPPEPPAAVEEPAAEGATAAVTGT